MLALAEVDRVTMKALEDIAVYVQDRSYPLWAEHASNIRNIILRVVQDRREALGRVV